MTAASQTFLFADLAGFTALTEAHGDEEAADLAERFFGCVRVLLDEYGAAEVKTIGDAIMLRCGEPAPAVSLGLAILEAVDRESRFPSVRIGMHTGEAVERGGDWFGSAVNTAARVSGAAADGEVLLSDRTREAAGAVEGVELQRHGEIRLKNLPEPTLIFRAMPTDGERPDLPVDPVCRMTIAERSTIGRLMHGGVEYQFCSLECAAKFARHPERYV